MKKILIGATMLFLSCFAHSQNGLENIIVEKYYVANAADAAFAGVGALHQGSVTYRVYADMLPGYKFQALYGVTGHELNINSTTPFFNNEDRGGKTPEGFTKVQAADNTVMLDSWFSVGGASSDVMGILKADDDGVSNVTNADGILANNDADAGIALTTQDGFITGTPEAVTFVGLTTEHNIFNATSQVGNSFSTTNGSIASLNGSVGPTAANRVLIGQFTTRGTFSFELNIQIGTPTSGVQNYVASNPVGAEISIASLIYSNTSCSAVPSAPASVVGNPSVCLSTNPVFSTADNALAYSWSVSNTTVSFTSGQATPTVTTSLAPSFTAATLSVTAGSDCGVSAATTASLVKSANLKPVLTGSVTSTVVNVCPIMGTATNVTHTIPAVANAATYTWTVPAGVTLISGQGTTTIVVNYTGAYVSGSIGVKGVSDCGNVLSTEKKLTPVKVKPKSPALITGPTGTLATNVCSIMGTATNATYSTPSVLYATSYLWTVPAAGATIVSGQGTTTITVNYSAAFVGGDISVAAVSGCGTSAVKKLTLKAPVKPVTPLAVVGPKALCGYANTLVGVDYAIAPILGATSYLWTVPAGMTIQSGGTSTNMHAIIDTIVFSGSADITVSSVSGCGSSIARTYSVTEGHITPTTVSGFALVCGGTTTNYSVPVVANATSYNWTVIGSTTATVCTPSANTASIAWGTKGGKVSVTITGCGVTSAALAKPYEVKLGKCRLGVLVTDEMMSTYPNPSQGSNVTVALSGLEGMNGASALLVMYDILGKPVYTNQNVYNDGFEDVINTQGIAPGMYMITVQIGEEVYTQKVMISSH